MSYQDYNQNKPPGYSQQTSSLAVISLIAGISSYIFLPLLGAIVAVITGNMAKKDIYQNRGCCFRAVLSCPFHEFKLLS